MLKNNFISFLFIIVVIFCFGCDPDSDPDESYFLNIQFNHLVDGEEIIYGNDNIFYANEFGNPYSVRRLLYVLSDVVLYFEDDSMALNDFIFVNTDDAETLNYNIENLPGLCLGISFRLGFSSEKNIDNEYLNSPNNFHNAMVWPNLNGTNLAFQGGYHYMKLEGKCGEIFYNTHTGPTNAEDFSILSPVFNFTPSTSISINMNVNNWYNDPIYDMSFFGSGIMDNIDAQNLLYQNGSDIFSLETQ
ncbi:MAG: hypothetical protein CMD23_02550 [Flavobacteriales bacterium]|nr:hypothetical protein [Flavobacteriales bacterium]